MVRLFQASFYILMISFSFVGHAKDFSRVFNNEDFQKRVQKKASHKTVTTATETLPQSADLKSSQVVPEWKVWTQAQDKRVTVMSESEFSENRFHKNQPLTMFHPQTKNVGTLTGNLKLNISKSNQAHLDDVLKTHDLKVLASFPHIDTYYVTPKQDEFDFEQLTNQIKNDSRVNAVTPEVLSRVYERK
ncbi:MAG: hypothetical protein M9899_10685 [Bdellovibrionaceae bacterium]|nr:hypothetical protein [Pseudobdellovibrionaceae bacterium]